MTPASPVDVLVFGPHPDDIEIGLGGTVAKHVRQGHAVGLCDLTRGELGSNGTVDERRTEAEAAGQVLGTAWRLNLEWPDGGIGRADLETAQIRSAVELIRKCRPAVAAIPYWRDRHPDHEAASRVLRLAVFRAGLRRYAAEGEAWKPRSTCYYFINDPASPSFVVDVSDVYETKRQALACHTSQFRPSGEAAVETRLTGKSFLRMVETRDASFGAQAGIAFAEGVVVESLLVRPNLMTS